MINIHGEVHAGLYQIFSGSGMIRFSSHLVPPTVFPQWWGALKVDVTPTENVRAINAAIASLATNHIHHTGGVVFFSVARWVLNDTIVVEHDSITLQGAGQQNTRLDFDNQASGNGIELRGASWVKIRDLTVTNAASNGIALLASQSGYKNWSNNGIESVRVQASGKNGIYMERGFLGTFTNVFSARSTAHRDRARSWISYILYFHLVLCEQQLF